MNVRTTLLPLALAAALMATAAQAGDPAAAMYTKKCATCHSADGHGDAKKAAVLKIEPALLDFNRPASLSLGADELRKIVAEGKGKMPAYGKTLKPAEIDALVAHVETLRKAGK